MKPEQLRAIKERAEAATPGPWAQSAAGYKNWCVEIKRWDTEARPSGTNPIVICDVPFDSGNAEFIAHARQDIPALLAEVERLQEAEADKDQLLKVIDIVIEERDQAQDRLWTLEAAARVVLEADLVGAMGNLAMAVKRLRGLVKGES